MTSILTGWRDDDRDEEEEEQVEVKSTGQGEKNPTVRKGVIKKIHVLIFLITLSVTKILHLKKRLHFTILPEGYSHLEKQLQRPEQL